MKFFLFICLIIFTNLHAHAELYIQSVGSSKGSVDYEKKLLPFKVTISSTTQYLSESDCKSNLDNDFSKESLAEILNNFCYDRSNRQHYGSILKKESPVILNSQVPSYCLSEFSYSIYFPFSRYEYFYGSKNYIVNCEIEI